MDGKDDDDMDALLNNRHASGRGPQRAKAGAHKGLITEHLRKAYGQVASEPMPDRFLEILNRLDETEDDQS